MNKMVEKNKYQTSKVAELDGLKKDEDIILQVKTANNALPIETNRQQLLPKKQTQDGVLSATQQNQLTTFKANQDEFDSRSQKNFGRYHNHGSTCANKGPGILNNKDRNSLESISSKYSASSANDDSQKLNQCSLQSTTTSQADTPDSEKPTRTLPGQRILCSRIINPPNVTCEWADTIKQDDKLPSIESKTLRLATIMSLSQQPKDLKQPNDHHHEKVGKNKQSSRREKSQNSPSSNNQPDDGPIEVARDEKRNEPFLFAGIVASIVGSLFFSTSVLCVKLLPDADSLHEKAKIIFTRGVLFMTFCGLSTLCQRGSLKVARDELWVNVLRALFGTLGIFGAYCSLNYISLGDSTALIFSSPIWTSILSYFILGEPLQWIQLLALPLCLLGIILIAHPDLIISVDYFSPAVIASATTPAAAAARAAVRIGSELGNLTSTNLSITSDLDVPLSTTGDSYDFEHRWPGIAIALATSFCVSCTYIVLKYRKSTPIQTTTFWLGVATLIFSVIVMCFIGFAEIPTTIYEWTLLFANGVLSWLGQSSLQWAFAHEEAGVLSIVRTLDIAITFMLSALFLDEEILWTSIVGAAIIALVVVSIMLNNWIGRLTCMTNGDILEVEAQASEFNHCQVQQEADSPHAVSIKI